MFKQGLKDNVKAESMRSGAQIDTLDTLINESICLENELHELAIETRAERAFHVPEGRTTVTYRQHKQGQLQTKGILPRN
jgi:hypothetical protein